MTASTTGPGDRWRQLLRHSAVPEAIAAGAPEPVIALEPERFRWKPDEDARQPVRPSRRRALEALPEGGSVLDVGVGGGASSLGLVPKVGLIVGVDAIPGMLESFTASARSAGVATRAVLGAWPQVADQVEAADIAVCHHAVYRVEGIEDFLAALTEHALRRVVLEVSANGPHAGLDDLWKSFHGIERPTWEVADELQGVLGSLGVEVDREDLLLPPHVQEVTPALVEFVRGRLYVGPDRDPEIEAFLRSRQGLQHRVVALWWPGGAA